MKLISLLLLITFSASSIASALSEEEKVSIIENVAKSERRNLWVQGHEHVDSGIELMSTDSLTEYFSNNGNYENTLDSDEEVDLYKCLTRKSCELYLISLTSEYYSGYGVDSVFVQLNIYSGHYNNEIRHNVYSE